jgi:hypothetical protein
MDTLIIQVFVLSCNLRTVVKKHNSAIVEPSDKDPEWKESNVLSDTLLLHFIYGYNLDMYFPLITFM